MMTAVERVESRSPQQPSDLVVSLPVHSGAAVAQAVNRARAASWLWRSESAQSRSRALTDCATALDSAADELTSLIVREVGKPITEARGEVVRAVDICRYHAQSALQPVGEVLPATDGKSFLHSRRSPYGVAGLITPWNFPLAIPLWKLAPALAAGNAALWKPAPEATAVALRVAELFHGLLPDDLLSLAPGGVETGAAVVELSDVLSFTGSDAAGTQIRVQAARRGTALQAETGGINASIVLDDADFHYAVQSIALASMGFAGQKCTATRRVIVVGDAAAFAEALVVAVAALPVGDPNDPATVVGPVISAAARAATARAAEQSSAAGATVFSQPRGPDDGHFVAPIVVVGGKDGPVTQTEVFGPICAVQSAGSIDEAIDLANATPFGLAGAVFTNDLTAALAVIDRLEVGLVKVNAPTTGVDLHAPFGGLKASGYGPPEQGVDARQHFLRTRTALITPR